MMGGLKVLGLSFPVNVGMLEKHCSLISVVWFKVVVAECYGKEKMELLCMKRLRKALGHSGLGIRKLHKHLGTEGACWREWVRAV